MGHRHDNLVVNLKYERVDKSIIYVVMHKLKASINMLSRSKTQQLEGFTNIRMTSDFLVATDQDGTFVPTKNFLIQAPLQKFPFV